MTLNIAVLASTRGTDMQAVIDAIEAKQLDAKIVLVVSDKKDSGAIARAQKHGIETFCLNPKDFSSREEFDKRVMVELEKHKAELILLIGYMRFLSKPFVEKYRNKIMNIHPSLLPAFAGGMDKNVHQTVLDSGCKVSGCTLHFVDEGADTGPIILQKAIDISENETVDSLKEKVQAAEQETILKAIRLFAAGKLSINGKKVRILQ
jgi:formyltetrahydrofolate-dependent phosphoribosylglycinamide formyltransferase